MTRAMCMAIVVLMATAVVQATNPEGSECPSGNNPTGVVSLFQRKLKRNVLTDNGKVTYAGTNTGTEKEKEKKVKEEMFDPAQFSDGFSIPSSDGFLCNYADLPQPNHLKVFQVSSQPPEYLNVHNRHFLPPGVEFFFADHHKGMEESMMKASVLLEKCGVVSGAYEALMMLRPIAFRADIWRIAMLWVHGGLYMDHKVALLQSLDSFVNSSHDTMLLPRASCLTGGIPCVSNALLWSRPRHPFLAEVLRMQVQHVRYRFYGHTYDSVWAVTGPKVYEMALESWNSSPPLSQTIEWVMAAKEGNYVMLDAAGNATTAVFDSYYFISGSSGAELVAALDGGLHADSQKNNYYDFYHNKSIYCDELDAVEGELDFCDLAAFNASKIGAA